MVFSDGIGKEVTG